jgi:hypothetical protein
MDVMNERIRELLVEAREQTKEGKWNAPTSVWAEKFAELIVRECMTVTKNYTCNQGLDYSAPVALARHFGVEK